MVQVNIRGYIETTEDAVEYLITHEGSHLVCLQNPQAPMHISYYEKMGFQLSTYGNANGKVRRRKFKDVKIFRKGLEKVVLPYVVWHMVNAGKEI